MGRVSSGTLTSGSSRAISDGGRASTTWASPVPTVRSPKSSPVTRASEIRRPRSRSLNTAVAPRSPRYASAGSTSAADRPFPARYGRLPAAPLANVLRTIRHSSRAEPSVASVLRTARARGCQKRSNSGPSLSTQSATVASGPANASRPASIRSPTPPPGTRPCFPSSQNGRNPSFGWRVHVSPFAASRKSNRGGSSGNSASGRADIGQILEYALVCADDQMVAVVDQPVEGAVVE